MNEKQRPDDAVLDQVDRMLEHGRVSDEAHINALAHTRPEADWAFQQGLEQRLIARLQTQQAHTMERQIMTTALAARRVRPISITSLTWTVAVATVVIALVTVILINLNNPQLPLPQAAAVTQVDSPVSLVIATQKILPGTVITDSMLGTATLSAADMEELRSGQPDHTFITDAEAVIGQTAAVEINWFQPIESVMLGEVSLQRTAHHAPAHTAQACQKVIRLLDCPWGDDTLQGLQTGERVDVLSWIDGQIRVVTANVLLVDVTPGMVTLGAPSWQQGILISFYQTGESYALRLHTGEAPETFDEAPVDYVFTAPESLPGDYVFDLIVNVPAEHGYMLTALPASIDDIPFTSNGDTLHFWFKNLEVISITNGTTVAIRLPAGDAANLDYLIGLGMELTFIPDDPTYKP